MDTPAIESSSSSLSSASFVCAAPGLLGRDHPTLLARGPQRMARTRLVGDGGAICRTHTHTRSQHAHAHLCACPPAPAAPARCKEPVEFRYLRSLIKVSGASPLHAPDSGLQAVACLLQTRVARFFACEAILPALTTSLVGSPPPSLLLPRAAPCQVSVRAVIALVFASRGSPITF